MDYQLNHTVNLKDVLDDLGYHLVRDCMITGISPLNNYQPNTLTFAGKTSTIPDGAIVITAQKNENALIIYNEEPRKLFVAVLDWLYRNVGFDLYCQPSVIDPSVRIGPNVVIEAGCIIAADVVIEANSVIHKGTVIGERSRVRSCTSVGSDGFGFENINGRNIRFQHLGRVIIGNDVEIGAGCTIARGTLSDTVIEDDVKIDNLVHIAHNVHIGKNSILTACAEVSGSVNIGENVWIAPNATLREKISIADNAVIGLGAVVTKSVKENAVMFGNPAKVLRIKKG